MQTHHAHRVIAAVLCLCTLLSVCTFPAIATPAWSPSQTTSIYVATNGLLGIDDDTFRCLENTVTLAAAEFSEKLNTSIGVRYGSQFSAGRYDLVVRLIPDAASPASYSIETDADRAYVKAADITGVLYGLRHVLGQLLCNGEVSDVAKTSPDVAERAVSLDIGRKYFTPDWIKQLIREMSWNGMNTLVLRFSEEMGLGIESVQYPWLNGRDGVLCVPVEVATDTRQLTQNEVRDIVAYAKLYHVNIIPSLNTPGHMNYIVKRFNERSSEGTFTFTVGETAYTVPQGTDIGNYYDYNGRADCIVQGTRNTAYSRGIDLSNALAVAFTKSLIAEYAHLFSDIGCTAFDLGGDDLLGEGTAVTDEVSKWQQLDHWKEYAVERTGNNSAVAYDAFLLYMNDLGALLNTLGYRSVRMDSENAHRTADTGWTGVVRLDDSFDVNIRSSAQAPSRFVEDGHSVINCLDTYTSYALTEAYFTAGHGGIFPKAYADSIYGEWTPFGFSADETVTQTAGVLGGALTVRCDDPTLRTEAEIFADILPLIRSVAVKCWDADIHPAVSYAAWLASADKVGSVPAVSMDIFASRLPDNSRVLSLIEQFDEEDRLQNETYTDTGEYMWAPLTFENYRWAVEEARSYMTDAVHLITYTQDQVDSMCDMIEAARAQLCSPSVADPIRTLLREHRNVYVPRHEQSPYVPKAWENYVTLINESQYYMEHNFYEPSWVEFMNYNIREARKMLYSASIANPLQKLITEYRTVYAPRHAKTPYTLATWVPYVRQIEYAIFYIENMVYTPADVAEEVKQIEQLRDALILDSSSMDIRLEGLTGAGFMNTSIRRGNRPIMIVHTRRDLNMDGDMITFFVDGMPYVDSGITVREMPYDPKNPDTRSFIITLPVHNEPGTYTYCVRGAIAFESDFRFTTDYIDCTIRVR